MKIRKSKRQSAWEFMRRNRVFLAADVMMITRMGEHSLSVLISQLKKQKILVGNDTKNVPFAQKTFTLLAPMSVVCPVASPSAYTKKRNPP